MTKSQQERFLREMESMAGESVKVEKVRFTYYVYGSELACLRIFAKYNANGAHLNKKIRVNYSENLSSWYVSLDS